MPLHLHLQYSALVGSRLGMVAPAYSTHTWQYWASYWAYEAWL